MSASEEPAGRPAEVTLLWAAAFQVVDLHNGLMRDAGQQPAACNRGQLKACLGRPRWRYTLANDHDVVSLAAHLASSLAQGHASTDGNKRTAYTMMGVFLFMN